MPTKYPGRERNLECKRDPGYKLKGYRTMRMDQKEPGVRREPRTYIPGWCSGSQL